MKAITVRQPWAWAIIYGGKDVENRTRSIAGSYRGPLAIHASLAPFEQHNRASELHRKAHGTEVPTQLHFGCVIGVVDLVGVHRYPDCLDADGAHCSWWGEQADVWHLELENPRPLPTPSQYPGALGLWELPDHLLRGVR